MVRNDQPSFAVLYVHTGTAILDGFIWEFIIFVKGRTIFDLSTERVIIQRKLSF